MDVHAMKKRDGSAVSAVELMVILIDEVISRTTPKPACPHEVVTRSSKSQSASARASQRVRCNFLLDFYSLNF